MNKFFLLCLSFFVSSIAFAQVVQYNERITRITNYQATVGTATADAIATATIGKDVVGWKICNNAVNTSTYLLVGQATDVSTDGMMLDKGQCLDCVNCTSALLDLMKVEGQAADNGYSIVVYRK